MNRRTAGSSRTQRLAQACVAVAMMASMLAVAGSSIALGQEAADCEVTDLGTLGSFFDRVLEVEGRWTTEDCDSRFRAGSDAHTYRFEVADAGRVRIGLSSAEADAYLYLLTEDGGRIADNDDTGAGLDARVERDLAPGVYLIEATTVGGRDRGPADFTLTVSRLEGCDSVHLGTLEPGVDLTAEGSWSLETCGSRYVAAHPAHSYSFNLAAAARVRIDLESENGDPVLSLASLEQGIIGANDDGAEGRNSRIEQYLQAGVYLIEATTYLERDRQPLQADFTLTVHIVDETARQQEPRLKIEEVRTPAEVVAGDPFTVHYRIGNLGGGELPDDGSRALIYLVGPRVFDLLDPVSGVWDAGVAYHAGDETASASSTATDEVAPFEVTFSKHGPTWLFVGVVTQGPPDETAGPNADPDREEIGFHGLWHNLMVLSGPAFEPVDITVGSSDYTVTAEADTDGEVTTTVALVADPDADVDPRVRLRAIYTAGVLTQILDGVFERPALSGLSEDATAERINVANPSSSSLISVFGQQYAALLSASGLIDGWRAGEAINPNAIEELWLDAASAASSHYASMAADWRSLLDRTEGRPELSFQDAVTVHSQVAYAESIVAPAVATGDIITAARRADGGWEDPGVWAMMAEQWTCSPGEDVLREALEAAGAGDIDELVALDSYLRLARPVHGLAVDQTLCAAAGADAALWRFLQRLSVSGSAELREMLGLTPPAPVTTPEPPATPEPHRLQIIVRLADDGRSEYGVELAGGERILPPNRFLPADAAVGHWHTSGDVEVDGSAIGKIRARHVADGRTEVSFRDGDGDGDGDGEVITPDIAFLPADLSAGVWYRSSEIEVPAAAMMSSDG